MAVLKNSLNEATLWANATTTFTIVGNSSVSNVCFTNQAGLSQNVSAASIRKIICSVANSASSWEIKRGANQCWFTSGNYTFDFQAHGMPLTQDKTGTIVCTLTGGGTILIDISKESV